VTEEEARAAGAGALRYIINMMKDGQPRQIVMSNERDARAFENARDAFRILAGYEEPTPPPPDRLSTRRVVNLDG